jgi:hypothetical protein
MAVISVLLDDKNRVIGTARSDAGRSGQDGPAKVSMVARPGQRLVELNVSDAVASLSPDDLHARIEKDYLKEHASRGRAAR